MKNHRFYIKAIAVLLLLSTFAMSFTACSSNDVEAIEPSDQDIKVVGNAQTVDVLYEELRYLTVLTKETMESQYGISIWDNPTLAEQYKDELTETVMAQCTSNAAVVLLAYEAFGEDQASIDSEVMSESVQESMENFMTESFYLGETTIVDENGAEVEYNAIETYKKWLTNSYMTDHLVRYNIYTGLLESQLLDAYISEDIGVIATDANSVYNYITDESKFARVMMIFIENDYGENVSDNYAQATEIRNNIANGADFENYLSSSEDFNDPQKTYYYIPQKGSNYGQDVADAAFGLEIGELSDVIETSSGFYILKRMAKDTSAIMTDIGLKGTLYDAYLWSELYTIIDDYQSNLEFKFNEYGLTIDLTKMN